jgi:hypothetical protein
VRLGRRTWGFLVIAFTMLLLYAPTPSNLRWINLASAALAIVWFCLFALEDLGAARRARRRGGDG